MNIQTILSGLLTTQNLYIAGVVLAVLALVVIIIMVSKKFGLQWINSTKSIVTFVQDLLKQLNINNQQVNDIISTLLQGILFALAINTDNSVDTKVNDSLTFIDNILTQLKITVTPEETIIIKQVLQSAFVFIAALGINKVATLKYNKVKYNLKGVSKLKATFDSVVTPVGLPVEVTDEVKPVINVVVFPTDKVAEKVVELGVIPEK